MAKALRWGGRWPTSMACRQRSSRGAQTTSSVRPQSTSCPNVPLRERWRRRQRHASPRPHRGPWQRNDDWQERALRMLSELRQPWPRRRAGSVLALACVLVGAMVLPAAALTVEEIVSRKGIKAWLVEEHSVPLIAIRYAFVGGAVQDPAGKEGLADVMSDLLTEGAGDMPAAAFKERFLRLGSNLSAASGRDAIFGGLETLSARFEPSAELLRLMVTAPRFDRESVEQVRAQHLTDLAQAATVPTKIVVDRWYAEAFPGSVYARAITGTSESVARITPDDLKAQHARLFARD